MHSSLVLPYAGYGDLAAATCVAAPPLFPLPLPLFVCSFLFFTFVWPPRVVRSSSFGFCVFSGHLIMPSWLDRCNFFFVTRVEGKRPAQCSGTRNPNVSSYESHPASGQLATHSGRNNETDPTNNKISLNILLSNEGLVQKPLEPLQQGQRISMQPSKCFKSEGLEGDRRLLTRQQDSIARLLVLGSARGGPTRSEVQQGGNFFFFFFFYEPNRPGLHYMAFSRTRSPEGLSIVPGSFDPSRITVSVKAKKATAEMRATQSIVFPHPQQPTGHAINFLCHNASSLRAHSTALASLWLTMPETEGSDSPIHFIFINECRCTCDDIHEVMADFPEFACTGYVNHNQQHPRNKAGSLMLTDMKMVQSIPSVSSHSAIGLEILVADFAGVTPLRFIHIYRSPTHANIPMMLSLMESKLSHPT
jgi:hypothetical protein